MTCTTEMFTHRQAGMLVASLHHTVPVATESLLSTLTGLTTILWLTGAGPVTLGAGYNEEQITSGAVYAAPDHQLLTCAADCHRLEDLSKPEVGKRAESAPAPTTPLKTILW